MDESKKTELEQPVETVFTKYRGKLSSLYGDEIALENRMGKAIPSAISKIKNKDAQELYITAIENPTAGAAISDAAYYLSNAYASIIDYYKTFFHIRYTVTPQIARYEKFVDKNGHNSEEYATIYSRMMERVEGVSLDTILPQIIEETLIRGTCAVVTEKNAASDALVTTFLPTGYFKKVGMTQFGTNIVAFDFQYFRDLRTQADSAQGSTSAVTDTNFDTVLASMPQILQDGFHLWDSNNTKYRWQVLDPKKATIFLFNERGIPPKLGAFPASIDYSNYKKIELENASNQLNKILTHKIPIGPDGDLIFTVDESLQVASEMRKALGSLPSVKLVTTFGDTEYHDLQKDQDESIKVIDTAYNNIFSSAGIDYHVFISDKDLEASIKRDKAYIWNFLQVVMKFYNVAFNNIYNFNPYQASINLLPITLQQEAADIKQYFEYAGTGVGRLNAIVSTGIKQCDIKANYELEKFLNLDEIIKPLQSMYTTSNNGKGQDQTTKTDSNKEETEQPEKDAVEPKSKTSPQEKEDSKE